MTTNSSTTPDRDPLEEAVDPTTDPERLRHLAVQEGMEVRWAVLKNPAVPEDVWRKALLEGDPEAWSNPMAPIYLLGWSPQPGDWRTLEEAARKATYRLWVTPERCSPDGKVLLNVQIMNWWAASVSAEDMMDFLWFWAYVKGNGSEEHKAVVRLLVRCLRTMPDLSAKDRQALDLLDAWGASSGDQRRETEALQVSFPVKRTVRFAAGPYPWSNARFAISELLNEVTVGKEGKEREEAKTEHDRLLADLIRRGMPLPPQVK